MRFAREESATPPAASAGLGTHCPHGGVGASVSVTPCRRLRANITGGNRKVGKGGGEKILRIEGDEHELSGKPKKIRGVRCGGMSAKFVHRRTLGGAQSTRVGEG
jgi:hypothetical protein